MTGFGGDPKISRHLHDELVKRLRKAIDRGVKEAADLDAIVNQIVARAGETGEIETVDILAPAGGEGIEALANTDGATSENDGVVASDGSSLDDGLTSSDGADPAVQPEST
jgi:hypothetical protein